MNYKVVVLGRNYNSILGMIRAVGQSGYSPLVIMSVKVLPRKQKMNNFFKRIIGCKPIESSSKYVDKCLYYLEKEPKQLLDLLIKFKDEYDKIIVIPTDDCTASTIDIYQKQLGSKFICPNIDNLPGKIVDCMDKKYQKQLAKQSNLNIVNTWEVNIINGNYEIPLNIKYPVFTKPQLSFLGQKEFMKKCENKKELNDLLNFVKEKKKDCKILIEQFVTIEKEYAVLGCSYNNDVVIPGIIQMIKSGNGSHRGVTLIGQVSSFDEDNDLLNNLKQMIIKIKFNGLFDIDLYESDGKIYFNELNLRFGASGYAITKSGVNLPQIYINKILNKKEKNNTRIDGSIFINEKVNLDDYRAGYISYKEYKENEKKSDFGLIKSSADKRPYKSFKRMERLIRIKKKFK